MNHDPWGYRKYGVSPKDKDPLIRFMINALHTCGCRVLHVPPAGEAPFRITFETPEGERMGILVYAFLANQRVTKNRPADEHRWQVKYGKKDGTQLDLWQDPYGIYTTVLLGINPEVGFFVGADPVLHSPTRMFISLELKQAHVDSILREGWASWERERRNQDERPVEIMVGGRPESFLRYLRFEREATGEDQGHRHMLAERSGSLVPRHAASVARSDAGLILPDRLHSLAQELALEEHEVMDLIERAPRLKMAVRGWVAEEHLYRQVRTLPGVTGCERIEVEGGADVAVVYNGVPLTIECKNVLRRVQSDGRPRIDFQRTRASKADPCSRYYSPDDFSVLAGCLHAMSERWEFKFIRPAVLAHHKKCPGKLANNVVVDERWTSDAGTVLGEASRI